MAKKEAYLICHTHWDREWYLTREQFKPKLVRLFDTILDLVENSTEYIHFMMDGQVIALEDYLEIRPENKDRIINAVKNKRISIGPWYVLPDEMLISGESHIRNYLIGDLICKQFGSKMNHGYLPDSFGHPEQMPQILKGLSMDTAIFWRGTANFMEKSEFYWSSPFEKSKVLSIHMPFGYGNVARLETPSAETYKRINEMINQLRGVSTGDKVLLMNGSDHILIEKNILEIINNYNKQSEENFIKMSSMDEFISNKKRDLIDLATYSGEFRYGDRAMVLGSTTSSRVGLKQKNLLVEKLMERYIEPMASYEMIVKKTSFSSFKNYLWKKILENHPHDSICGCSVDAVHTEMEMRFENVLQLENTMLSDFSDTISKVYSQKISTEKVQLVCFSPSQKNFETYLEVEIDFDTMLINRVNYAKSIIDDYEDSIVHPELPLGIKAYDSNGNNINAVLISANKDNYMHLTDESAPEIYKVNRCKVGLLIPGFDYGYNTIYLEKTEIFNNKFSEEKTNEIENEFYKIVFNTENNTFTVKNKILNKTMENVCKIIDTCDSGDEYTYSWPKKDAEYNFNDKNATYFVEKQEDIYEKFVVEGVLNLPESISEDRTTRSRNLVPNYIKMVVVLYKNSEKIDFSVEVENNSKDHILKIEIPAGILDAFNFSSTPFAVTKHNTEIIIPADYMEIPLPTNVTHGFISVNNDNGGVCISTNSFMEYETINYDNESKIRLVLMRSVGWLSRPDLETRKGNGGWMLKADKAQCIGKYSFDFALIYVKDSSQVLKAYEISDSYLHKIYIKQIRIPDDVIEIQENLFSFISSLPKEIRLSAVKPAENDVGIVLRMFNISEKTSEIFFSLPKVFKQAFEVSLNEETLNQLNISKNNLSFSMEKGQIKSIKLLF